MEKNKFYSAFCPILYWMQLIGIPFLNISNTFLRFLLIGVVFTLFIVSAIDNFFIFSAFWNSQTSEFGTTFMWNVAIHRLNYIFVISGTHLGLLVATAKGFWPELVNIWRQMEAEDHFLTQKDYSVIRKISLGGLAVIFEVPKTVCIIIK